MIQFLPCKHNLDVNFTITSVQTQYLKIVGNTTAPRASAVVTCSHNILGLSSGTFQRCMGICDMTLILMEEVTRHSIHAVFQNSAMFHYSI